MTRTVERNQQSYVGVTSAMAYIKTILGEKPDYYGPHANIHAAEGEGCHKACLDWLAAKMEWFPGWSYPAFPEFHPSRERWDAVIDRCLKSFQEFVEQYEVDPIGIEQEDFSEAYRIVGHIDLPCHLTLKRYARSIRVKGPVDLKFTNSILESHRLQTRCYGRLNGMKGSHIGGIFQCNRETGKWKFEEVNLLANLDDVQAVSHAASLYVWGKSKKSIASE